MERKQFINVYLSLGSNQGNRLATIKRAEELIDRGIGRIARRSSYYETAAWGKTDQGPFINCVIMINTTFSPREILEENQKIERELGREVTGERWGPRVIDIDILFYGRRVLRDKGIEIPHPELPKRLFVLVPMMEIAETYEHPLLKQDMVTMYAECTDTSEVIMIQQTERKVIRPYVHIKDEELQVPEHYTPPVRGKANKPKKESFGIQERTKTGPKAGRPKTTRPKPADREQSTGGGGAPKSGGGMSKFTGGGPRSIGGTSRSTSGATRPTGAKPKSAAPKSGPPKRKETASRTNKPPKA
jgi:2-amino-4-hydroxy-6-hydroxymethyldihydropteridine diphosphokinase